MSALGASLRATAAFLWSEAVLVLASALALAALLGWLLAEMLVAMLQHVFDPPPDHLAVPWSFLAGLAAAASLRARSLRARRASDPPPPSRRDPARAMTLQGRCPGERARRRGRRRAARGGRARAQRRRVRGRFRGHGRVALERVERAVPDVVVIDIGLPDTDGRDLCQALRARGVQTPVLFLTARDAVVDRIAGFDAGGDDYLAKPFAFVELVARLQALLRRSGCDGALESGGLTARPGDTFGRGRR